jgi:hypothetical protein
MLYGRPFLPNDLAVDPETDSLLRYLIDLGTFQQAIHKLGDKLPPAPLKGEGLRIETEEWVLIKS